MVESYGRKIFFIPMPDMIKDFDLHLKLIKKKWLFDSYCRLFLGTLLPKIDRVLYVDADTLCNGDISELWHLDLDDNIAAGVVDCLGEPYYNLFEMSETSRYCNSGMMLFDLKKWREQNVEQQIKDYVDSHNGYVFFMEQSVMNIVLADKIKFLPPKFNVYTLMPAFTIKNLRLLRNCKRFYSDEEINYAINHPVIIHFTSIFNIKNRPWMEKCNHPYVDLYHDYMKKTPWGEQLQKSTLTHKQRLLFMLFDIIPQNVLSLLVGYIYNYIRPRKITRIQQKYRSIV